MTEEPKRFGRPRTYPLHQMDVGDCAHMEVPTAADVKRVCRNVSQYGLRYDRFYRCSTDRKTRRMTITRIR